MDVILEAVDPRPREAQAWMGDKILKQVPPKGSEAWKVIEQFVERLLGSENKLQQAEKMGVPHAGSGVFGSVYGVKPKDYPPLAVKFGRVSPDLAYSEHIKGVPPIVKHYNKPEGQAIVMPFIPGRTPTGLGGNVATADLPGGPGSLDVYNILAEANKKGMNLYDAHTRNLVNSTLGGQPRTWMVDRGGIGANITPEVLAWRKNNMMDELYAYLSGQHGATRFGPPAAADQPRILRELLLNTPKAAQRWPDLFELMYEDPALKRFLP